MRDTTSSKSERDTRKEYDRQQQNIRNADKKRQNACWDASYGLGKKRTLF